MSVSRAARRSVALVVAALAVLTMSCGSAPEGPPRWNVVMVLVDTLRADHLSLYGYRRPTSPRLAALAAEGVLFTDVSSQAGCTYPSVDSLLTSRYPQRFLTPGPQGMGIPADVRALPEMLAARGWDTGAVSASVIVRRSPSVVNSRGGFGRGFRFFDERCRNADARCVNRHAFEQLERLREPFFLYLHYLEPHQPYRPPPDARLLFAADRFAWPRWVRRGDPATLYARLYGNAREQRWNDEDVAHLVDLYDDEVRFFDDQLGELLARLDGGGRGERTLVVLLSDHGEELLDHGHWGHCRSLAFDSVLSTPLVLRVPGVAGGLVRSTPVTNLDVVPTILDYLRLPRTGLDGRSLRPAIEADRRLHRYRFALQGTVRVVDDGRFKLLRDIATGEVRLFDLESDPGERRDLAVARPDLLGPLRQALEGWVAVQEGAHGTAESVRRAREGEAKLRAVGYL